MSSIAPWKCNHRAVRQYFHSLWILHHKLWLLWPHTWARFPPGEAVTFFLERAWEFKQYIVMYLSWRGGEAERGPARSAALSAMLWEDCHTLLQRWPLLGQRMSPVPWRSSWFLTRTDEHSSSACFNRMNCGLMIFWSSATLQAPGEPPCCFGMGPVQILAPVRSKVPRFLYPSLSKDIGSRQEKQLARPTSTAGLVQGRSKKDSRYSHPLARDEWWCWNHNTFLFYI